MRTIGLDTVCVFAGKDPSEVTKRSKQSEARTPLCGCRCAGAEEVMSLIADALNTSQR